MSDWRDEHPDYPDDAWDQATWHLSRAGKTEGVTEDGMLRTAIVESVGALVVALFEVAGGLSQIASAIENDLATSVDRIASANEK